MPNCQNCGGHVSRAYARVFVPDEFDQPRVCPECPDKVRTAQNKIRDKRTGEVTP